MTTKRSNSALKALLAGVLILFLLPLSGFAGSGKGVLPWGTAKDKKVEKKKSEKKRKNLRKRRNRRNRNGIPRNGSFGLLQSLRGRTYVGLETSGSAIGVTHARTNNNNAGLNLEAQGFFLDPRLWQHNFNLNVDRSAFNAPLNSAATNGVGFNFNGTLFGSRSFPLRVFFNRRTANTNFSGPSDTRTRYRNLGASWSLSQPKLANITLTAMTGRTTTDPSSAFLPFSERMQSLVGTAHRSLGPWRLTAAADYSRVRSTFNQYQYILRGQDLRLQRPLGERGNFTTSWYHLRRTESDIHRPYAGYSLLNVHSLLGYRHTEKLHGFYSVRYLSNLREAAVSSALGASTGSGTGGGTGGGTALDPNPALQQALQTEGGITNTISQGNWTYRATQQLSFNGNLIHGILSVPDVPPEAADTLLSSYTTSGGGIQYARKMGRWNTTWRGSVQRTWNRARLGTGFASDSRSFGVSFTRGLRRWTWTSLASYSDYQGGRSFGNLYRRERWTNSFERNLTKHLRFNFGAELFHVDSNISTSDRLNENRENGILFNGTFAARRWTATMGRGLRNVNSAIFALDLSNPLNTVVLSQVNPLAASLENADRYTFFMGSYRATRTLVLHGAYRRDHFLMPMGDFNFTADADLSVEYRLRAVSITTGYRRLRREALNGLFNRDMIYVRIGRPFRIF